MEGIKQLLGEQLASSMATSCGGGVTLSVLIYQVMVS